MSLPEPAPSEADCRPPAPRSRFAANLFPVALVAAAVAVAAVGLAQQPVPAEATRSLLAAGIAAAALFGWGEVALVAWPSASRSLAGPGRWGASTLVGAGVVAMLAFGVAAAGLLGRAAAITLLLPGLAAALVVGARRLRPVRRRRTSRPDLPEALLLLSVAAVLAITLLASLPPPTWFDALEYHLVLPAAHVAEGGLAHLPNNFFGHLPHGVELLDALLFAIDPALRAGPFHWALSVAALAAVARVARRAFHPGAGLLAVAILLSFREASLSLFVEGVDLPMAGGAAVALELFLAARRRPKLLPAAFLAAGFATSFKVHGVTVAAAMGVTALLLRRDPESRPTVRQLVLCVLAFSLPLVPWGIRNLLYHGNPAYPFLVGLFGGAPGDAEWVAWIRSYTRAMTIEGGSGPGFPVAFLRFLARPEGWTPLVLAALAAPFARSRRPLHREGALLALLLLGSWWAVAPVPRYLFATAAILAPLAASGLLLSIRRTGERARLLLRSAVAMVVAAAAGEALVTTLESRDPLPWLLGTESSAAYTARLVPDSPAPLITWANENLPEGSRILSLDEPRMAGLRHRFDAATVFDRRVLSLFGGVTDADRLAEAIRAAGFTHLLSSPAPLDRTLATVGSPYRYSAAEQELLGNLVARHGRPLVSSGPATLYELAGPGR